MFELLFYKPMLNLLVFLYNIVPGNDLGVAIILLTVIIKLILLPLSKKAIKGQRALQEIQPEIEKIKQKHAKDREALGRATMELYKEKKVNPFSSCLPLFIQMPFLFAVFRVFRNGFGSGSLDLVYGFIHRPELINTISLGTFDLSKPNNLVLALLAGFSQYIQTKMIMGRQKSQSNIAENKQENMMGAMNKQMMYVMPVFTGFIAYSFSSGLALYWFTTTVLTILQQHFLLNTKKTVTKYDKA